MRFPRHCLLALLLAAPMLHAQVAPDTAADASDTDTPAKASSTAAPADQVDLDDVRNFAHVYQIIRQAYVEKVDNKTLMNDAIKGMLSGLDPHSAYLDKEGLQELNEDTTGQYGGLGIEVMEDNGLLRIVSPIDDTPASRAGIKPGDVITAINGKAVTPDNIDDMFDALRGDPGTKITLGILHEKADQPVTMSMTRERISMTSVKVRELEPGYAYIRISQFQDDTASDLEKKLGDLLKKDGTQKGAILDLRSNPGGLLTAAVGVSNDFLDSGTIVTTRGRLPDSNLSFTAHPGGDMLNGAPMVLLTDNGTASAAEIVSGALKDNHRALIVGRRTFGKGVVQTVLPLDDTHAVKLTTARYYTPNGTSIQAEGIKPDIALADLTVAKVDDTQEPINSEADLPHHLANEATAAAGKNINNDGSAENAKLATTDYALSQALNILKGLALRHDAGVPAASAR
ncbi:S41 family peptidase [Dyella mobilis]|uniref:S41 family peptidase n=1 Tax=Dyella mobilis TaxID=1849582 RepID=A0ABS2KDH8_9GAMM|nr:S41 family peptidase [Dyella mobilis]MBM7129212.1 S41 family peptidase [Dyella mobilis]GLQ98506.1 peptidase S41 [Dyella mobilis]